MEISERIRILVVLFGPDLNEQALEIRESLRISERIFLGKWIVEDD